MRLVKVSNSLKFGKDVQNNQNNCPKPKHIQNQSYGGVVIVENPKTQAALRTACRIIAADMYEKGKKA
ncbi:MAG: hypothetical protein K6A44_05455 [bacterium]|nr:hypothetical protein [bacterium]